MFWAVEGGGEHAGVLPRSCCYLRTAVARPACRRHWLCAAAGHVRGVVAVCCLNTSAAGWSCGVEECRGQLRLTATTVPAACKVSGVCCHVHGAPNSCRSCLELLHQA
jgi:hypothetical protein